LVGLVGLVGSRGRQAACGLWPVACGWR